MRERSETFETSRPKQFETLTSYVSSHLAIVGRQHELTLLMNHYKAVSGGQARVVLLAGEPGIGKTRLLKEVALRTSREGGTVLYGNASEDEGMPPFLPFLEAIGRYIRTAPQDQLRRQLSSIPQTLANLLPELAIYRPDLLSLPVPSEQARFRLYEAIGTFLEAICEEHALVLILDNLQWADTASLDLLRHLAHYQAHTQLFILGAYREGDIERNTSLAHTIAELSRQRILSTLAISPLSEVEVGLLALGRYENALSSGVTRFLHVQSEGNPFIAEELLAGWIESGVLRLENQQWVARAPFVDTLPSTIVGAFRQRLAHLAPAVVEHLRVAAIIGRSFEFALLATIEEQEDEVIEECLLEAVHARIIQIDQNGCYCFSHDKIRECLYSEVSISRRRRLHSLIGHVLETRAEQEHTLNVYRLADLAFHFARSDDQTRGVHYSLLAATQSLHTAAIEKAMSHYAVALALLRHNDSRRGDILLHQGEAALLAGNNKEAETIYETAKKWFLQSNTQDNAVYIGRATHGLGLALWRQEKRREAYETLEIALAFLGSKECVERVKVLLDLSQLLLIYLGKQDEGLAYAQQALAMARNLGETALETTARRVAVENLSISEYLLNVMPDGILPTAPMRLCLALSTMMLGEHERAKSHYSTLLAFRGQHYWFLVDRVLGLLAMLHRDWETATIHLAEAEVIARREKLRPELARTLVGQANVALGQGGKKSVQQAIHLLNEASVLFETLEMEDSAQQARHQLASLSRHHHDTEQPSLPAGLTPREVEVLNLVTRGRSNSQIAQELVISEKTVINHLTHIFNKTNSENRAAATAFAIRHDLA